MKILLLPDFAVSWSTNNRCEAIKKYIPEHEFTIVEGVRREAKIRDILPNFDVIHFNYTGRVDNYAPILEELNIYPKTVLTIVNERSLLTGAYIDIPTLEKMMSKVGKVTSVSEKIAKLYHCEYIPNGVDFEIFPAPKKNMVGFIGSRVERKGFLHLEQACKELGLTLKCLIWKESLISHLEMQEWYRSIDVLAHPSLTEGCSNVVLEALAMNVPVITRKSGIWDKLGGHITIVDDDYNSLYEALEKYSSRSFIESNFNWRNICRRYKEIYDALPR
jgi:glycosyltransferase involved in cell wall biosynthesis